MKMYMTCLEKQTKERRAIKLLLTSDRFVADQVAALYVLIYEFYCRALMAQLYLGSKK